MYPCESERIKKIHDIISTMKLCGILFYSIAILNSYAESKLTQFGVSFNTMFAFIIFATFISLYVYSVWSSYYKKHLKNESLIRKDILETIILFIITIILIICSGEASSNYKFLFIFIVIIGAIQFGTKIGITIGVFSSIIILGCDLIFLNFENVNLISFESDVVLSLFFIMIGWLLGNYCNIEEEFKVKVIDKINRDELTNTYNYTYFLERLEFEIEYSKRNGKVLSLLFIDINYFKQYNDIWGYQSGNNALKKITKILRNIVSDDEAIFRYGGDEFAVILPNTDSEKAVIIGEKIQKEIASTDFAKDTLSKSTLTVSIGISVYPKHSTSREDIISKVEEALYRAKFSKAHEIQVYNTRTEKLRDDNRELVKYINTFIDLINLKDKYIYRHTERLVIYCEYISKELGLSYQDATKLRDAAYLHDIGKIYILEEIVKKQIVSKEKENAMLKKHPQVGADILRTVDELKDLIPIVLYHHERCDGKGYPYGLKKEQIPYLARILYVLDSFEKMTFNNHYEKQKTYDEAINVLIKNKNTKFDGDIVNAFIRIIDKRESKNKISV